jgi:protein-disulfide isomerase
MQKKIIIGGTLAILALAVSNLTALNRINALEASAGSTITNEQFVQLLSDNPEAIMDSVDKFNDKKEQIAKDKAKKIIEKYSDALYQDKNDPIFGNPNGKHVVVEFIDYNCGYCKKLSPTLAKFIELDPEAKVIVKEYPIFTNQPTSQYSAEIGTALSYFMWGRSPTLIIY